jgi:hypothetical protein
MRLRICSLPPQSSNLLEDGTLIVELRLPFPGPIWEKIILPATAAGGLHARWERHTKKSQKAFRYLAISLVGEDLRRKENLSQIGTVDQIPDLESARKAARLLVPDLNARVAKSKPISMTIAQLCSHFEQFELNLANTWRSYSTKTIYKVYLKRWIIPKWGEHLLSDIRTIEVESWLRSLPIARSTCAKIRDVMSVLFNHACRYEFFDGNPIRLVRQSAKRRSPPVVLTPG